MVAMWRWGRINERDEQRATSGEYGEVAGGSAISSGAVWPRSVWPGEASRYCSLWSSLLCFGHPHLQGLSLSAGEESYDLVVTSPKHQISKDDFLDMTEALEFQTKITQRSSLDDQTYLPPEI
ncbi:hypothetical protein GUJ93_ZPchr0001g31053 [Zizania palustris]|uniref:Uncharacterized protein n=1 Tax=Zizania palustris TaxID=103762 RepID=A0A8J5S5N0_ZIZPA|nr:hypothetical protein GUJ93_ZPchr0001g31053 [Zizania palustris]